MTPINNQSLDQLIAALPSINTIEDPIDQSINSLEEIHRTLQEIHTKSQVMTEQNSKNLKDKCNALYAFFLIKKPRTNYDENLKKTIDSIQNIIATNKVFGYDPSDLRFFTDLTKDFKGIDDYIPVRLEEIRKSRYNFVLREKNESKE